MATVLIAAPVAHSRALRSTATVSRGLQAQKRLRVTCRQASASGDNGSRTAQDEVAVLQSSTTTRSPPLIDWISIFFEKEVVQEPVVPAPKFQLLEPVTTTELMIKTTDQLHRERVPRRSERTVIFTEEKARRLRKENRATQPFHDKWYHSAIASRLATPE